MNDSVLFILAKCCEYIEKDLDDLPFLENTDTGVYAEILALFEDTLVVVFRGTEFTSSDILTDINLFYTKVPAGEVHTGFYLAFKSIANELLTSVRTFFRGSYGHIKYGIFSQTGSFSYLRYNKLCFWYPKNWG